MRIRRFSFLKNELLILLLLTHPLISTGCGTRSAWGIPVDELSSSLSRGDYSRLAALDLRTQDVSPALELGPAAPYCLSVIFQNLKQPEVSRRFLELAWTRSPDPWKTEAGISLGRLYVSEKSLDAAMTVARDLMRLGKNTLVEPTARRILVEALYWNKEDAAVLQESDPLLPGDVELSLFRAVSSLRLAKEGAQSQFVRLFLGQRASSIHARAYLFLSSEEAWWSTFSEAEKKIFTAKYDLQQGDWTKAIPEMEAVLTGLGASVPEGSPLISELGAAYLSAGMALRGAAFMEKLGRGLEGWAKLDALEAAGKCARKIPDYGRAITSLRALAAGTEDEARQDRARWFILDALIALKPSDLTDRISKESAAWHDPEYFSDLLEEAVSQSVADRKWYALAALESALGARCPAGIKSQLSYILARALGEKLIKSISGRPGVKPEDLFRQARDAEPAGYYGTLSSCMLGEPPACISAAPDQEKETAAASNDGMIDGFLQFGLTAEALDAVRARRDALGEDAVLSYAREMAVAGDNRSAMNLMASVGTRRKLTAGEAKILYPRAFASLIEAQAATSYLPVAFLYGMIREESYFDPDIVSSAGAVGLAQLMPATAADVAKRLKMQDPILTDPQVSLRLGVSHLMGLLDRVGSLPMALLSYNAGLTRSRSWDRQSGTLGLDLFVESVPYEESRQYVRKIMVSTVIYAFLYENIEPGRIVALFYPDIFASASGAASVPPGSRSPY